MIYGQCDCCGQFGWLDGFNVLGICESCSSLELGVLIDGLDFCED